MAFAEDLSVYFDTDEFAVTATLGDGSGGTLAVIFDKDYIAALGGQVTATQPQALAMNSDITRLDIAVDSPLIIEDVDYVVRDLQPAFTGTTLLLLETA